MADHADRLSNLEAALQGLKLVTNGMDDLLAKYPPLPKDADRLSVHERLTALEKSHDNFKMSGGPNTQVSGSIKTGFCVNNSCPEVQGTGTFIPPVITGCASLGVPTCTFEGITLDCGCISDGIDGPVDWQDGEFGPSYQINQAITLSSGLFGCSPCSDEACWSFFGSPINPRPIAGWHLGCADLSAGVDVWGFVLCNGDTSLEVALIANHGDDPQPIFFHGTGTRDVPINNDLVCGGGLFSFPFCGLTDWSVRGQGGTVTVTF